MQQRAYPAPPNSRSDTVNIRETIRRIVDLSKQPLRRPGGSKAPGPVHGRDGIPDFVPTREEAISELQQHLRVIKQHNVFHLIPSSDRYNARAESSSNHGQPRPQQSRTDPETVQCLTLLWALCVLQHYDTTLVPVLVDRIMSPQILLDLDLQQHGSLLASLQGLHHPLQGQRDIDLLLAATTSSLSAAADAMHAEKCAGESSQSQERQSRAQAGGHAWAANKPHRPSVAGSTFGAAKRTNVRGPTDVRYQTCRQALRVARGLAYQQSAAAPSTDSAVDFSASPPPSSILRGEGAMQRAWLAAFKAATLPGLATADPWDLAPAAEALAEMSGPPTFAAITGQMAGRSRGRGGLSEAWLGALGNRTSMLLGVPKPDGEGPQGRRHSQSTSGGPRAVNAAAGGKRPQHNNKAEQAIPQPSVTLQHLTQLATAAARLGCTADHECLSRCIEPSRGRFAAAGLWNLPPNTLADIAWALAKLGLRPGSKSPVSMRKSPAAVPAALTVSASDLLASNSTIIAARDTRGPLIRHQPEEEAPLDWTQTLMEATHLGLPSMRPTQLVRCLDALVTMGIKPYDLWLRDMELRMWYSIPVGSFDDPGGDLVTLLRCLWRMRRAPDHHTGSRMVLELTRLLPSMTGDQVESVLDSLNRLFPNGIRDRKMKALIYDMRQRLAAGMCPNA